MNIIGYIFGAVMIFGFGLISKNVVILQVSMILFFITIVLGTIQNKYDSKNEGDVYSKAPIMYKLQKEN